MAENMNDVFGNDNTPIEGTVATDGQQQKKDDKKAVKAAMKAALQETLANDPDFEKKVSALSDKVEMIHSLGYSGKKSLILDKEKFESTKIRDKDTLLPVPAIVGYQFRNNSDQAIPYTTEVFTKDEATGNYVGKIVEKTWAPGEIIALSRKYTAVNFSRPEFSFTLKNGLIITAMRGAKTIDEQLSNCYFKLADGSDVEINDDGVKVAIDDDKIVKPEFIETFGYLMNKKSRDPKASSKTSLTTQAVAANYIRSLIDKQQG